MPSGQGEEIWTKEKSHYKGQFLNGAKHGKGVYHFADKSVYEGIFKNDKFHG